MEWASLAYKTGPFHFGLVFEVIAYSYPIPDINFQVDHPFLAAIWDKKNNLPLFLSRVLEWGFALCPLVAPAACLGEVRKTGTDGRRSGSKRRARGSQDTISDGSAISVNRAIHGRRATSCYCPGKPPLYIHTKPLTCVDGHRADRVDRNKRRGEVSVLHHRLGVHPFERLTTPGQGGFGEVCRGRVKGSPYAELSQERGEVERAAEDSELRERHLSLLGGEPTHELLQGHV
uniref:Uncharacterized protein n=1 Tax=Timema tahoe TaxID=61484 RepID=A0A7R9ICN2_9NEOP|nr:unnamed protein product [Timema tahoe]